MRPYAPNASPELATEIMTAAARQCKPGATVDQLLSAAAEAWKVRMQSVVYDALLENMNERTLVLGCNDEADKATDPAFMAKSLQALDDTIATLSPWTGHDWIGQVLGVVDPTNDEALERLFVHASFTVVSEAVRIGEKNSGSIAKWLSSQHITANMIEEQMSASSDPNEPFHAFRAAVLAAATDMMGEAWTAEQTAAAANGDQNAASQLLLCGGYAGSQDEINSLHYALSLQKAAAPAPIKPASTAVAVSAAPVASAEGASPAEQALAEIRTITSLQDADIGELIGVSRTTVKNMAEGKAKKRISVEGCEALAARVRDIISRLAAAEKALLAR